jgi:uncharacterized protein (UPF0264 family)
MAQVEQILRRNQPGLLVSVRSADEALAAIAGGADVIDVKEPLRGPLGAADRQTIAEVVRAVDGRAPVTAAAGELEDLLPSLAAKSLQSMPLGVSLVKIGLAQCETLNDWRRLWRRAIAALQHRNGGPHALPVAVIYADWKAAATPRPELIHMAALAFSSRVVLIDTWNKSAGNLFDHWPREELNFFVNRVRRSGLAVVLAGSLTRTNLLAATELRPHLVAVRGAACDNGRNGAVSQRRVEDLRQLLNSVPATNNWHAAASGYLPECVPVRHKEFS